MFLYQISTYMQDFDDKHPRIGCIRLDERTSQIQDSISATNLSFCFFIFYSQHFEMEKNLLRLSEAKTSDSFKNNFGFRGFFVVVVGRGALTL